ncbi:hypothetical protein [Mongoliitalea lutea]|uniref:Uncharacterized protein n=1 Tax=Mongoliitalea lutea TaxID=849756 RepID=A0A8J3CZC4_9BACT|nr:hypothetical protein [Mongoliitalea lutea]GHB46706.1 hypothetical protein GCM10008106_29590 [Mongoliitalea lutea]
MTIIFICLGFIAFGTLTRLFPRIFIGTRHFSSKEKEFAIENGLHIFLSYVFIAMGMIPMIGYFVGEWLGQSNLAPGLTVIVSILGAVIIIIAMPMFAKERF